MAGTTLQVLVSLLLLNLFASAQMYGYPYPYMQQQYPVAGGEINGNNFGGQVYPQIQGYPQVYPQVYPQNPYSYPGYYPSAPVYPQYPQYPSYPSYPGAPSGYPDPTGLPPQFPPGTNIFPSNYPVPTPQSVQTQYGNIPVEIIDIDETREGNDTDIESMKFTPVVTESKNLFDLSSNPVKNTKIVRMEPSETKIVRTFEPKGEIHVDVQTPSPGRYNNKDTNKEESKKGSNKDDTNEENNEENDTTTTKWKLFG